MRNQEAPQEITSKQQIACTARDAGRPARAEPQDTRPKRCLIRVKTDSLFPETGPILLNYFGPGDEFEAFLAGSTGKSTPPSAARV